MTSGKVAHTFKRIIFGLTVTGTTLFATTSCSTILNYVNTLLGSSSTTST